MPRDDSFQPWLGRIRRDRSFSGDLRRALNLARGGARVARSASTFTGARIGRGAGVGRVLGSSDRFAHARARRVIVKTRIVKLGGKGAARAAAHLRYLQRDGTTRAGERGSLYAADRDVADSKAFLGRGSGDRHQFRFIVAAEDGAEYDDLKPLVRRLMEQAERDLGTSLDWVAVDHFNTGHPHSHILVRGKDERGADLVIAREYLTQGLRGRATELVNLDLGPRSDHEILVSRTREIAQERFTQIDRRLIAAIDPDGLVSPGHRDGVEQASRAGRLQTLARLGLASEERRGRWRLDPELEPQLKAMGRRGDIIATMQHEMGRKNRSRNSADYAIHEAGELTADAPERLGQGFGDEVRRALALRRQWLIEQGLAEETATTGMRCKPGMLATLQRRELARISAQLSRDLGLNYTRPEHGDEISGIVRRPVQVGDTKFALIENSREFTLVPWRDIHERAIGKSVSGIMRETGSISWTLGRSRGLGIG